MKTVVPQGTLKRTDRTSIVVCTCGCRCASQTISWNEKLILTEYHSTNDYTGIDFAGYSLGMTDKFQGTGVFSGIKMEREPKKEEATTPAEHADASKKEEEKKSKTSSSK